MTYVSLRLKQVEVISIVDNKQNLVSLFKRECDAEMIANWHTDESSFQSLVLG